jgi:hypothetical protein
MIKRLIFCTLLFLAACQPTVDAPREVITPFPTMTPGRVISGELLIDSGEGLAPATAVAISRQPTETPDFAGCPPLTDEVPFEDTPPVNEQIIVEEITRYLTSGGNINVLEETLREEWAIIGEGGIFRNDIDLTGEGTPEVIISYTVPQATGALLVAGCAAGTYQALLQADSDTPVPPSIIQLGDVNRNQTNELVFAAQQCERNGEGQIIDFENCGVRTQLVTWQPERNRFVNLLPDDVLSINPPTVSDVDNDEVSEVVVQLESSGTSATGPLRTGVNVYDWDGGSYLLSIVQLEPPRYRIQIVHEGDRLFSRREWANAIPLYRQALQEDNGLRYWFDDEVEILRSYALYRLAVTQIAAADPTLAETQLQFSTLYPDPLTAPVYIQMAQAFIADFTQNADVRSACEQVRAIIQSRPEALDQLNRYGTRSPRYTAQDLCPF